MTEKSFKTLTLRLSPECHQLVLNKVQTGYKSANTFIVGLIMNSADKAPLPFSGRQQTLLEKACFEKLSEKFVSDEPISDKNCLALLSFLINMETA